MKIKIRLGKYSIQSYPIGDKDMPKNWRVFTRHKIFGHDFAVWEIWNKEEFMKNQLKFCSLKVAKNLKKIGIKQKSSWYWVEWGNGDVELLYKDLKDEKIKWKKKLGTTLLGVYSAFTSVESAKIRDKIFKPRRKHVNS